MRKTAIVTGSAQGIGRSIALRLAADGMNVTLNDLPANLPKLEALATEITNSRLSMKAAEGPIVHIVVGDVSESTDVQNMVKETVSKFGALDVVSHINIMIILASKCPSLKFLEMIANAGIMLMGTSARWRAKTSHTRSTFMTFSFSLGIRLG